MKKSPNFIWNYSVHMYVVSKNVEISSYFVALTENIKFNSYHGFLWRVFGQYNVQNMLEQNAVVVSIYLFSSWANRHPNTCKLNPVGDLKTYQTLFRTDNVGKLFDTIDQSGKVSSFKTTKCQKYETNLGKHNPMWRLKVGLLILLRL